MPIPASLYPELRAGSIPAIQDAHRILLAERYHFIAYHGCNMQSLRAIVPYSFDITRLRSEAGTARDPGSMSRGRAASQATSRRWRPATKTLIPIPEPLKCRPGPAKPARRHCHGSTQRIFLAMRSGTHYAWGVLNDPSVASAAGRNITQCAHDLEIVFHPIAYSRVAALPSLGLHPGIGDPFHLRSATWPAHKAEIAPIWKLRAVARTRPHSDGADPVKRSRTGSCPAPLLSFRDRDFRSRQRTGSARRHLRS
jgi:hypothetical protein